MAKKIIKKPSIQDILNGGKSRSIDISNYNNYESNDNTQVNNVVRKKYNTNRDKYLEPANKIGGYRALKTTAGKVGTALGAVPFAVAAIPALGASGEAAAPYLAKIGASAAVKPILTTLKNPWVDAALTSTLGAEPLSESYNNIKKGKFGVEDAINTLPVTAPIVGKGAQMLYKFKNKWIPIDYNSYLNERNFNTKVLYRNQDEFKKASDEIRSINKEINKTQPALSNVRKTIDDRNLIWESYGEKYRETEPTYILKNEDLENEINKRIKPGDVHLSNIGFSISGNHYGLYNNRNGNIGNDLADFVDSNPDKFYYNTIKDFSKIPESKLSDLKRKYGINLPYDRVNNRFNLTAESPYTTGSISVPNFKTGKTETFYIPERFDQSHKYISGKYPFETSSVVGDPKIKHLPPQEYTRLTKDNIDEIINNYLGEAKPFGSSVLVSEGKINHGTHDYDFIMSLNDAKNHPDFDKWYPKRYDKSNRVITYGYEHPKYGELDINVIHENDGKAFGSLANELSIEQNPKLYADWRKKDLINNKESDVVPQSAKELLTNMNPSDKTLLDMMFSDKSKHVDRLYDRLNYEDVDEVSKQIDNYYNVVLGGKYKKPNIPLSEFTDPEKNAKMLQGLKGIDVDKVKYEPERVKMLVEYIAGDKFFNGRGVDPRTDNTLLNSMNKWVAETHGGTANGVGLNTVVGGDSGYGDVYASIIPKGSKSYDDVKTLDNLRNVINHNTGNIKLSNEDRNFINKAIKEANEERIKQGLKPIEVNGDNFNLADVLEATEDEKGEPLKKLLNKIYERFNIPAIANREFGYKGQYASLTTDQDIDNIAQLFSRDIDRPKSILNRGYNLSTVNSNELENTQRRIKEISKHSVYGKTKERIDDVALMKHLGSADSDLYFQDAIDTNKNMLKNKHKQQIIKEFNEKLQKDKIRYKNIGDILDYLKDSNYKKDRNAYAKIRELRSKLELLDYTRRGKTEKLNTLKNSIRDAKTKLTPNDIDDILKVEYDNYHDKLKSQDDKLNNFKNLININNMINSKKDRKKYAGGGKVPPAAAPVRLQINPTNLPLPFTINKAPMTNGEFKVEMARQRGRKMVSDYKDWLNHADKRTFDAVMKMKNTTEPTVPYIKISTPEQREALESAYNYAKETNSPELPAWEYGMRTNSLPGATCINTITDKYGRPIASNVDLAKNYKKYGYKKVNMKEMEPGDIVQLSMNDTPFHAMMATSTFDPIYKTFSVDQSHGGYDSRTIEHNKKFTTDRDQLDIRSGKIKNDIRALDKSYNYINDNGIQLYRKVWDTPEYRNGGKVTAKQDAIASYKKPIPMDKIKYTPTIGVRIPTDSELRRQKEIESLTPNERYEYRRREAANEKRNNEFKALLNGFNNTFGRAASLASLIYGGGWAANRLIRGNKSSALGQHLSKYMIPANTIDTYGDAIQFITNPSLSNGVELGAGIVGKKYRDYGKKSRQLFELGTQGLNAYNSYKFGGDIKATPKRKHENNYIMKGTGTYVPKTPQEKVVVDLYNANYKSARKNMPREDALRQAHYRTTQQMMESGYGTSKQARKQNNFGGMGGSNSYKYNTIKDFTDHVDSTMLKNFKDSYKAPTLNKYINGLYNGRIGAYSETPIEVYSKEMKGTHPRTSKIIEQLNPDDYSLNQLNINPYYNEILNPYIDYNRDIAKFGGCKRPKAFWGAVIGAGLSIASNLINKNAEKKAAKRQAAAEQLEQNRNVAGDITTQLNQQADNSDPYYAQFRTEFAKGGKVKGRKAVITDGGVAIPINKNMSLLRGSTHNEINESGNTGIGINFGGNQVEAQNGEIVRKKNGKLYIYSDEPMQNGISPAKRVLNGENPDKVYNAQENYKRNHNIKTNKKYVNGGVAGWLNKNFQGHQFTNGSLVNAGVNLLGQGINFLINKNAVNKLKYTPAPIQAQAAKLNTTYNVSPQIANLERNRMRTNEDITRNTSSSVAALNRRNYANLVANDQLNSIYNTKNEAEHKMINEDRMNEQNVRNNNIQQYNAWNAQRTEFENSKRMAKAQNYSNLVSGIGNTVSSTINEARKAYLDDQNLKAAAAPYGDGVVADLARNDVHADSLYADRLRKLGNPKTPYDDALRTLYINSIQDPRLRYEFENDPEFAIPTPGNEDYTIGRLNNINLDNIDPIGQSIINNNNYLQSKFNNDWWTRMGKRQFRFPILNTYNNKSFIKVPYRA